MKKPIHFFLFVFFALQLTNCSNSDQSKSSRFQDVATGIVGGTEVNPGDDVMVSTVGIYDREKKSLCTGTLISADLVLTAAHCIGPVPTNMIVYFGNDFKNPIQANKRPVVDAKANSLFGEKKGTNIADIGLIRFNPGAGIPVGYGPARLLTDFSLLQKSTSVIVSGFGLNWAWVIRSGAGRLRTTELEVYEPNFSETEILLSQSLSRGVCSGDSGGPSYLQVNGQLYLWGVVSRGDSLPIPLTPDCFLFSVMTRVDSYRAWITATSQALKKY